MQAIKMKDDVYWVGVRDPELRIFDLVMTTDYGTSYNAYLVKGKEKTALIEVCEDKFFDEYVDKIKPLVNIAEIDYLIMNHTEPDHSEAVARLLDLVPNLAVFASQTALQFLKEISNRNFASHEIKDGEELDLGGKTLRFINAPFLHWPDTIYTYLVEDKILFSCDSFGSHYPDERLFNDLMESDFVDSYKDYFDAIIGPFKPYVLEALDKIADLPLDMVAPGHGPVLRKDIDKYIDLYRQWSQPPVAGDRERPKIVLAYISIYGFTKMLADTLAEGVKTIGDFDIQTFSLVEDKLEDDELLDRIAAAIAEADGLLLGSNTVNGDALPQVWRLLGRLSPITHGDKVAMAFGAYGWSGEAVPIIESRLRMLRMKIIPGLRVRMKPTVSDLEQANDFGKRFARAVLGEDGLLEGYLKFQAEVNPNNPHDFKADNYKKIYQNSDIMVYWNPEQCTHDTNCFSTLPAVFNPGARPWVNIDGDDPHAIIKTVDGCPSGALRYSLPEGSKVNPDLARGSGWIHYYDRK
mgnify:CR=1 FL=1